MKTQRNLIVSRSHGNFFYHSYTSVSRSTWIVSLQGLSARVLYQAPSTAIAWSVYEFFKYYLNLKSSGGGDQYETLSEIGGKTHSTLDQVGSDESNEALLESQNCKWRFKIWLVLALWIAEPCNTFSFMRRLNVSQSLCWPFVSLVTYGL